MIVKLDWTFYYLKVPEEAMGAKEPCKLQKEGVQGKNKVRVYLNLIKSSSFSNMIIFDSLWPQGATIFLFDFQYLHDMTSRAALGS